MLAPFRLILAAGLSLGLANTAAFAQTKEAPKDPPPAAASSQPDTRKVVKTADDLPPLMIAQIRHFFQHYKDLEPGKSASVGEWASLDKACERIMLAIGRAR